MACSVRCRLRLELIMTDFGIKTASSSATPVAVNPSLSPEEKLSMEAVRRSRVPMSSAKAKLSTPEIPGFHLHWLNDDGARISQALNGGYEFVKPEETIITSTDLAGDTVGTGTDMGSRVSIVVGKHESGAPMRAYLMKIPSEFYEEDQRDIQGRVDGIHEAMFQGKQVVDGESAADRKQRYVSRSSMKSTYSRRPLGSQG